MNYSDEVARHGGVNKAADFLGIPKSTFKDRLSKEKRAIPKRTEVPKTGTFTKICYFTDAHNQPGMSLDRFRWLARWVNEQKPDVLIDGGDFDDFNSLCSHEKDETYKGRLKPLLAADLEASAKAHSLLKNLIKHPCRKIKTFGNHEARIKTYENLNPAMYGILSSMYSEIIESTGWEAKPYGEYVSIDGVDFTHVPFNVMGKPVGGETACKQIADKSLNDVCYGHTHKLDVWNAAKFGSARSVIAFNGGCYMPDGYIPAYSKDTRKEFWYGAHVLMVKDGRIKSIKSWHISEMESLYGGD